MSNSYTFSVDVPWGIVRVEGSGSNEGIPEIDPMVSPAESNDGCLVLAVVHGDIGSVEISVYLGEGNGEGISVFDGHLECPDGQLEIADVVGEHFCRRYQVTPGRCRVKVWADDPEEAQRLHIRVIAENCTS